MQQPTKGTTNEKSRVAIIGAGFAGLRCASALLEHNIPVTIFEARNRLGGRVAQSSVLGHKVDLGPNWIHGSRENPILRIARETGTELHAWGEEEAVFDEDGKLLGKEEAEELGRSMWDDGLIAEAFEYSERCTDSIDPGRSLYDFFDEKSQSLFTDVPEDVAERKRRRLLQFSQMWGAYVGSPVQRQSLKFFWLERTIEGENPFVAGTYDRILGAVARPAREGADVRLGCKVTKITTGVGERERKGKVKIETADGGSEEFDEVVVTVPLGYLKRNLSMFSPPLPPRLTSAINDLGYGNLDKVYITFPSAFWNEGQPPASTPVSHPPANVTASDSSQAERECRLPLPGFIQWLPPAYASDMNPQRWDQTGINLAALPSDIAHPTLLFYVYGNCAKHIASLVTDTTTTNSAQDRLKDFFTPSISLLPHYTPHNPACTPSAILATAWTNDELAGYGSYSNFQTGLERGDEDIEVLREGAPERGLWFAGEATAPLDALGTTTGAYLSGQAVARRIAEKYAAEME